MKISLTTLGREVRQQLPSVSEQIVLDSQLTKEQYEQIKDLLKTFLKNELQ